MRPSVFTSSKTKHAPKWRALRDQGVRVVASWIDEAEVGQTEDRASLAIRCVDEAATADLLLLYCEPGEIMKGALVEVGAALACGVPVACVGDCESVDSVFRSHPLWRDCESIEAALDCLSIDATEAP